LAEIKKSFKNVTLAERSNADAIVKKHTKATKPAQVTKKEKKSLGLGKNEGRAELKYVRLTARKAKIVIDLIRNKNIDEAFAILKFTPKAASEILFKLLKSAEANAVNNNGLDRDQLYISDAFANQGPTLKRIMPRAQGRAFKINKRTTHITLIVKQKAI
jgi:large subunit ribosomal protein L22